MRLRASVRQATGKNRHMVHGVESLGLDPQIEWVEIEQADGAFYLFYFNANGDCIADTWHQTLEQAKSQARHKFEIEEADWTDVESNAQ